MIKSGEIESFRRWWGYWTKTINRTSKGRFHLSGNRDKQRFSFDGARNK